MGFRATLTDAAQWSHATTTAREEHRTFCGTTADGPKGDEAFTTSEWRCVATGFNHLVERQLFAQKQVFRRQLGSRRQSQPDQRDEVMQ